jgi:hypothetical protein
MKTTAPVPVRRGRPAARLFFVEEAADVLGFAVPWLNRLLEKSAASFFPHASKNDEGLWQIPERDMRGYLGPGLPKLHSVKEFAWVIGFPADTVYTWVQCGAIKHTKVFGYIRISSREYHNLPREMPACVPARPASFFCGESKDDKEVVS